jgi:ATP-binding cassette subfamily F protein uup
MVAAVSPPLLLLQNIHLTFGGTPLLEGAELSVAPGARLSLIGRNGSGKSTLLKIAEGLIEPQEGTRFLQPGVTLRYLPQEPDLGGHATTLDYVEAGLGPSDDPYRARYLLEQLGLTGDETPARLSGGEARRTALARVLAPKPDILLLDEPTNHLDLPTIEWLESELQAMRGALVVVSHDRRFLTNLSQAMVWVDRGVTRRLDQNFGRFEEWRDAILEQEETERHKLDRKIAREEDWVRYGVSGRRKRNQRRMADLRDLRAQRRQQIGAPGTVKLEVSEGDVSGKLVVEAKKIALSYGERPIVSGFSTQIKRGDRIGIVGSNGAGKTTLLRLLTGELSPDSGSVRFGTKLEIAYLDQGRAHLDPATPLAEALTGGHGDSVVVGGREKHVIGHMRDFLFTPDQARTPIGELSGGERGRVALARAISLPSNVLVLDEPTNDLDLETLDLLQEMIADYAGAVLIVSHDRDFLDRTVTSIVAPNGNGTWIEYAGGYSDMMAQRRGAPLAHTHALAQPAKPTRKAPAPPPAAANPRERKMSFKDRHALATLPARIELLQEEMAKLEARLADPNLYSKDAAGHRRIADELAAKTAELAAAEESWLTLEMLREDVEGPA